MQLGRRILLGVSAGLLVTAAACGTPSASGPSTPPSPSPSSSTTAKPSASPSPSAPAVKASSNLDAITVTGAFGKPPTVKFKAPFAIDKTRVKVVDAAPAGAPTVKAKQAVTFNYSGINARTGKEFDNSFKRGAPLTLPLDQLVPGFSKGLVGQRQGSRVLLAIPGPDGYDSSGGRPDSGINVGDTLLFVVDVVAVPLDGPAGSKVAPKPGLPTVKDNAKGVPEVTVPKTAPPKSLVAQPLIKGSGPKVAAGDTITFNYAWYTWDGKLVENSYGGEPGAVELAKLLPGMRKGLVNQTVGSRMLLVVPPADGYPNGNASPKIDKNTTLVFVVDLLFTQQGQ